MRDGHMAQCESCIQIKKKDKKKKGCQKEKKTGGVSVKEKRERERKKENIFLLFSKIYRNWTIGFRQSKRQSRSTH